MTKAVKRKSHAARIQCTPDPGDPVKLLIAPETRVGRLRIERLVHKLQPFCQVEYDDHTITLTPVGEE